MSEVSDEVLKRFHSLKENLEALGLILKCIDRRSSLNWIRFKTFKKRSETVILMQPVETCSCNEIFVYNFEIIDRDIEIYSLKTS